MVSGAVNDNLVKTALVVAVTTLHWNILGISTVVLANLTILAFIIPFMLFAGMAAHKARLLAPRRWLLSLKFIEILLAILAIIAILAESGWALLLCVLGFGVQSAFIGPLKYSLIPQLTSRSSLLQANAWMESGTFIAILIGTFLGANWITTSPILLSILIGCLSLLGIATVSSIPKISGNPHAVKQTVWQLLQGQFADKRSMAAIWCISGFWGLGSVWLTHLPILTVHVWQLPTSFIGNLLSYFVIGISAGAFLGVLMKKLPLKARIYGGAITIVVGSILANHSSYAFATLGMCITAAGGGFLSLPLYTMLQDDQSVVADRIATNNVINALMIILTAGCSILAVDILKIPLLNWFLILALGQLVLCSNHCRNLCLD